MNVETMNIGMVHNFKFLKGLLDTQEDAMASSPSCAPSISAMARCSSAMSTTKC